LKYERRSKCLTKKKIGGKTKHREWQSAKRRRRKIKGGEGIFFLAPRHCRARARGKSLLFLPTYSTAYPPYYTVINLRLHPGLIEGLVVDL
jgi:hypothetical protein